MGVESSHDSLNDGQKALNLESLLEVMERCATASEKGDDESDRRLGSADPTESGHRFAVR